TARGYRVVENTNVLVRELKTGGFDTPAGTEVQVRRPAPDEAELWARTVARGFFNDGEVPPFMIDAAITFFHLPGAVCLLAEVNGQPAGGGAIAMRTGVGLLF